MIVLGLDTSTSATAAALRLADGRTTQARDDPAAGAHPGHATRLLAMAHELLAAADVSWRQVDRIAVGVGPGTFTGLRVGVATARGLAQSLSAELVGVSSLRALAAGALAHEPPATERSAPAMVLAVIDARRGEVFAGAYESGEDEPRELTPARAVAPEALAEVLAKAGDARGLRGQWLAVGDGAVRFRAQLERAGVAVPEDASPLHRVSAAVVCELAVRAPAASPQALTPDYRRPPDAELALTGAGTGSVT